SLTIDNFDFINLVNTRLDAEDPTGCWSFCLTGTFTTHGIFLNSLTNATWAIHQEAAGGTVYKILRTNNCNSAKFEYYLSRLPTPLIVIYFYNHRDWINQ
ncbi:hypothetical protein PFISCL1PPCAC_8788, partial [Pristionchus fissidentatus]